MAKVLADDAPPLPPGLCGWWPGRADLPFGQCVFPKGHDGPHSWEQEPQGADT